MKLERLLNTSELPNHNSNLKITDICSDSRLVKNGNLFFLLEKNVELQKHYVKEAITKGASCIVAQKQSKFSRLSLEITIIKVDSDRKTLSTVRT